MENGRTDYLKHFERIVTGVLIVLMSLVVILTVVDLTWLLIQDMITPPIILLDTNELLEVFSMFLLILIGIELVETLKLYFHQDAVRAEVILLVTLIALSRKVITLDFKETSAPTLLGIAALIIALGIAYHIIKRSHSAGREKVG